MNNTEIKELTNGALIVQYATAKTMFYSNMNKKTNQVLINLQNELLDRNLITLEDLAMDVY